MTHVRTSPGTCYQTTPEQFYKPNSRTCYPGLPGPVPSSPLLGALEMEMRPLHVTCNRVPHTLSPTGMSWDGPEPTQHMWPHETHLFLLLSPSSPHPVGSATHNWLLLSDSCTASHPEPWPTLIFLPGFLFHSFPVYYPTILWTSALPPLPETFSDHLAGPNPLLSPVVHDPLL